MKKYIEKAEVLIEALPYIQKFKDKIFVIKYGGSLMENESRNKRFLKNIALLSNIGIKIVLVHGGGPRLSKAIKDSGKISKFHKGFRITDEKDIELAIEVLANDINVGLVKALNDEGVSAKGISGDENSAFICTKITSDDDIDFGFVGEIQEVKSTEIRDLLKENTIPVIASLGKGDDGTTYNINADVAALKIATAINARKLIYLSDIPGVLEDLNDPESLFSVLNMEQVNKLIEREVISGGMIPKIDCCIEAISKGINSVHLLDGRVNNCVLLEIFTNEGIGTLFTA